MALKKSKKTKKKPLPTKRIADEAVSNQVFIGCPWKTVRPKYVAIVDRFVKTYPLSFIIIGKEKDHSADDLLTLIKSKLETSSSAIFDVSGGNANVSLEFGFSEAVGVQSALYLNTHKTGRSGSSAIISDLAGKRRGEYKNEAGLSALLSEYSKNHPYTVRFEQALRKGLQKRTKGDKKRLRALSLKIVHQFDDRPSMRRADLTNQILSLSNGYKSQEIESILKLLHKASLIRVSEGRYSDVFIPSN